MKILHTSDWHLGHLLYQQKREDEHREFLEWLLNLIKTEQVDLLLVAGDIFDNGLPSNYALEMYYSFLARCGTHGCGNIIIVGGNHDSPSTLQAPKHVLKAINVTVVGAINAEHPENDLIVVKDTDGIPQVLVCAIPYLRDRDVYFPKPGEQSDARSQGIIDGTAGWYRRLTDLAVTRRTELNLPEIPIIATGHLFAQGMAKSGAERDMYVGDLGCFPIDAFPSELAYVALGHLHRPQIAPKHARVRYSGSPVPCSFDEAAHTKQVFMFDSTAPDNVRAVDVPAFRRLVKISGDLSVIESELRNISPADTTTWVEVFYTGKTLLPDLQDQVNSVAAPLPVQVLTCRNLAPIGPTGSDVAPLQNDLSPEQVFDQRIEQANLTDDDQIMVREAFQEILLQVRQGEQS
ncbi:MAG: exonuclease SbcCD subunit D C-terminal domain-containing protein [Candidatus Riflebacteria bacterium]|nr:exonuclease SbcCD subunit D C-terminal domain-containing protein [Candidatus Riflebacteria bacterium]